MWSLTSWHPFRHPAVNSFLRSHHYHERQRPSQTGKGTKWKAGSFFKVYTIFREMTENFAWNKPEKYNNNSLKVLLELTYFWIKWQGNLFHCRDDGFEESSQEQLLLIPLGPECMSAPRQRPCGNIHTFSHGVYRWPTHIDLQCARLLDMSNHVLDFKKYCHQIYIQG